MTDQKTRGQFFTVNPKIQEYLTSLLYSTPTHDMWRILEPSAGAGHILRQVIRQFPEAIVEGWEIDPVVIPQDLPITQGDFFTNANTTIKAKKKYHSIIGNPPYVAWKNMEKTVQQSSSTIKERYTEKANLYYLFMDRCIDLLEDNGEIVFIQPKEWLYSTSAAPLRQKIFETGTITHIIDGGEEKVFPDANIPAIMIVRYQKTPTTEHLIQHRKGFLKNITQWKTRKLTMTDSGYWFFTDPTNQPTQHTTTLGNYFDVKVGIITGADTIFNITKNPHREKFEKENTTQEYMTTQGLQVFIDVNDTEEFSAIPPYTQKYLSQHKQTLMNRRIKKFHNDNWWTYGAIRNKTMMETHPRRIYALAKTRSQKPFFINNSAKYFNGGLLALFPKDDSIDIEQAITILNSQEFMDLCESFGLTTANKVSFQPSTIAEIPFNL